MFMHLFDMAASSEVKCTVHFEGAVLYRPGRGSGVGALADQQGGTRPAGGNGVSHGVKARRVILFSTDGDLRALFERALPEHDRPVVAATEDELRAALASKADTVVIDAPAGERLDACDRARALHSGMVLVVVDDLAETKDWPSDLARRVLVRPLVEDEIVTALAMRPQVLREPAAARRRRLAQARRPPVAPPPIAAPEPPPAGTEPVRRLSTEENLWTETRQEPAAAADQPAPPPSAGSPGQAPAAARTSAAGDRRPSPPTSPLASPLASRRVGLVAAGVVVLLLLTVTGGIAIGRATAEPGDAIRSASGPSTNPGTSVPPTTAAQSVVFKTPAACDAALSDADAALSYLVGNLRDSRLTKAMQRYQRNRKACRAATR